LINEKNEDPLKTDKSKKYYNLEICPAKVQDTGWYTCYLVKNSILDQNIKYYTYLNVLQSSNELNSNENDYENEHHSMSALDYARKFKCYDKPDKITSIVDDTEDEDLDEESSENNEENKETVALKTPIATVKKTIISEESDLKLKEISSVESIQAKNYKIAKTYKDDKNKNQNSEREENGSSLPTIKSISTHITNTEEIKKLVFSNTLSLLLNAFLFFLSLFIKL
jgi:hypothetical protein